MKKKVTEKKETKEEVIEQAAQETQETAPAANMQLYESLRAVPKEAQKSFNNGRFSGTDINPMWRIKKMTEAFGPVGKGWYYEIASRELVTASDGATCAFVAVNLYVKYDGEWSKPIYGEGGNTFATRTKSGYIQVSDEAYKMALTDAISNATKQLGLGADIWFEKDVTKYTKQQEQPQPQPQPQEMTHRQAVADYAARSGKTGNLLIKYSVKTIDEIADEDIEQCWEVLHDKKLV